MRGLYAILDTAACASRGVDPLQVAAGMLDASPPVLQLRAKGLAPREELRLLEALREMTPPSTWLFGNDRPDLAWLAGCDGVHLGQSDLPADEARRFAPQLRIGLSTHSLEQLESALEIEPDYVALGPIFKTHSKRLAEPAVGLELLEAANARCLSAGIPLVAIGGIDRARLASVARLADCVAMIAALFPEELGAGLQTQLSLRERVHAQMRSLARASV